MKELLEGLQINSEHRSPVPVRRPSGRVRLRRKLLTVPVLLVAPLGLGAWYLAHARPIAVEVFTVAGASGPGAAAPTLTAGGYVRAARVVYVAPRVSGRLASLTVKEGDEVQVGDLIAEIDSRDLEQEAAEARANYELAQASLRKIEAGSRPEEIAEARARVQAVARATQKAERDVARFAELLQAGIISAQVFDQARTEHQVAEGNLEAARQVLARVEAGSRREDIDAARAGQAAAQARWNSASHRREYANVRAPIAGRVLKKFRNAGDYVSPDVPHIEGSETVAVGSPVVSLADLGRQEVSVDVNQTDIAKIALRQPVQVSPLAYPEDVLTGSVTQISPRADKNKNTVEVKVSLDPAARVLPYDMSVKLTFLGPGLASGPQGGGLDAEPKSLPRWTSIPAAAVIEREGRQVVFVVAGAKAAQRAVDVGARRDDMVAVSKGLVDGDRVIVSGLDQLKAGAAITVK